MEPKPCCLWPWLTEPESTTRSLEKERCVCPPLKPAGQKKGEQDSAITPRVTVFGSHFWFPAELLEFFKKGSSKLRATKVKREKWYKGKGLFLELLDSETPSDSFILLPLPFSSLGSLSSRGLCVSDLTLALGPLGSSGFLAPGVSPFNEALPQFPIPLVLLPSRLITAQIGDCWLHGWLLRAAGDSHAPGRLVPRWSDWFTQGSWTSQTSSGTSNEVSLTGMIFKTIWFSYEHLRNRRSPENPEF